MLLLLLLVFCTARAARAWGGDTQPLFIKIGDQSPPRPNPTTPLSRVSDCALDGAWVIVFNVLLDVVAAMLVLCCLWCTILSRFRLVPRDSWHIEQLKNEFVVNNLEAAVDKSERISSSSAMDLSLESLQRQIDTLQALVELRKGLQQKSQTPGK